jgi:ssDNA-binding Zn-finger/Zn-ribbon topoisomerase 1
VSINWLASAPEDRPDLETRDRGGMLHARCPACSMMRPGITIAKLSTSAVTAKGVAWACDGCLTKWDRDPEDITISDALA